MGTRRGFVLCYVLELPFICYIACPQAVSDQEKTGHKGASKPLHPELVSNEDQQHDKIQLQPAKLEKNEAPLVTAVVLALCCVADTRPLVKFYLNVMRLLE